MLRARRFAKLPKNGGFRGAMYRRLLPLQEYARAQVDLIAQEEQQ
jgi:hypothetical protein